MGISCAAYAALLPKRMFPCRHLSFLRCCAADNIPLPRGTRTFCLHCAPSMVANCGADDAVAHNNAYADSRFLKFAIYNVTFWAEPRYTPLTPAW